MAEVFTIDDAVNQAGMGKFQYFVLFLAGMGWFSDAFEILIQSMLGDYLACEWSLYHWQGSFLTSVVFLGMMLGCPIFGAVADVYGRKIALTVSMSMLFVFGAVSASAASYAWMAVFRGITGFAIGGLGQGLTLCSEYFPSDSRGKGGFYLAFFWAGGTVVMSLSNWAVMSTLDNWRVLLAVAAIPAFLVVISLKWYPESARFYLVSDQYDKAVATLERMAKMNKVDLPEGTLVRVPTAESRGRVWDLLRPEYRVLTLLFWFIWFAISFSYYGIALVTPAIIKKGNIREVHTVLNTTHADEVPCKKFATTDFIDIVWTSSAEIPGLIVYIFLVDHVKRRALLKYSCILCGVFIFLLLIESDLHWLVNLFLFGARALIVSIFQLIYIMTSEDFPTPVRAIAIGSGTAFARLGGLTVPYIAQVLFSLYPVATICVLGVASLLTAVAVFFLPIEMSGTDMRETLEWKDAEIPPPLMANNDAQKTVNSMSVKEDEQQNHDVRNLHAENSTASMISQQSEISKKPESHESEKKL